MVNLTEIHSICDINDFWVPCFASGCTEPHTQSNLQLLQIGKPYFSGQKVNKNWLWLVLHGEQDKQYLTGQVCWIQRLDLLWLFILRVQNGPELNLQFVFMVL